MKKKKKHTFRNVLIVIVVILAALFVYNYISGTGNRLSSGAGQNQADVETATVTRGSISKTTEGNGSIEAASKTTYTSDYDLKIDKVSVEDGDLVSAGDLIAAIDTDSAEDEIETKESELSDLNSRISDLSKGGSESLTAPVSGRVKRIYVRSGDVLTDVVKEKGGLMEINPTGKLKVEFTTSRHMDMGDTVTVAFSSYEEDGTVMAIDDETITAEFTDNANYQVDTQADIKDEDGEILGSGRIETAHPYLVDADYGIADAISVDVNDWVDSGSTLLTRTDVSYNADYKDLIDRREDVMDDLYNLRKLKDDPRITAQGNGIVSDLMLSDNTRIAADSAMYTLISTDTYWLKAQIDELDIAGVKEGQDVSIVFDAFDDVTYEGKVEKVSALGQNSGGVTTYTVTISLPGSEELKTAMSATATIELETKDDVLLIPVDAIYTEDGQQYVLVLNGDTQQKVQITTGIMNNSYAEVTEGLSEGQQVILKEDNSTLEDMFNTFGGAGTPSSGRGSDGQTGNGANASGGSVSSSASAFAGADLIGVSSLKREPAVGTAGGIRSTSYDNLG